jgi:hypothetical protein
LGLLLGLAPLFGCARVVCTPRFEQSPQAGSDEQRATDVPRRLAQGVLGTMPDEDADDRHSGLEETEDNPDARPGAGVNAREADPDGGREIIEPDGQRAEQQREDQHAGSLVSILRVPVRRDDVEVPIVWRESPWRST